jgi:hypothetical protein
MGRALIDPNEAPLRRPARDARDLMIAASNGWVVGYDNLSGIRAELSDCLCCLATGGGFGTRKYYTDDEERLFSATRPIMLNGIEDIATRPDLLDRAVTLTLPPIPDEARRDEDDLWQRFAKKRPPVLGALLDAVSTGLKNLPSVQLDGMPRMADFAKWVVACESALPWEQGTFLRAYCGNVRRANALALDASPVAALLQRFLDGQGGRWTGTAADLLAKLVELVNAQVTDSDDWPRTARALSGELRRLAPNLRRAGINVEFSTKWRKHGRNITLERFREPPLQPLRPLQDHGNPSDRNGSNGSNCRTHTKSNGPHGRQRSEELDYEPGYLG